MKIHLCSAYDTHHALVKFQDYASRDELNQHQLCDSPEAADVILFVEDAHFDDYLYSRLITHPYVQKWRDKCFMYNEVDRPWTALPGLYCSMPRWSFESHRQRAFPYAATPNQRIHDIYAAGDSNQRNLLFSFVGTGCNSLRKRMIKQGRAQGGTIVDTSGFNVWDCSPEEKKNQGATFARTMAQSKFVLCPRGLGTSSFRLFETMQAGRAPVIIADSWVEPNHCDWSFAVRIKEDELDTLADQLAALTGEAIERGHAARAAWENHYAPERFFNTACENLAELKTSSDAPRSAFTCTLRREQVRLDTLMMHAASKLKIYKRRMSST